MDGNGRAGCGAEKGQNSIHPALRSGVMSLDLLLALEDGKIISSSGLMGYRSYLKALEISFLWKGKYL